MNYNLGYENKTFCMSCQAIDRPAMCGSQRLGAAQRHIPIKCPMNCKTHLNSTLDSTLGKMSRNFQMNSFLQYPRIAFEAHNV